MTLYAVSPLFIFPLFIRCISFSSHAHSFSLSHISSLSQSLKAAHRRGLCRYEQSLQKKNPFCALYPPTTFFCFFPSYSCILSVLFVYIYHFIFPIPEYCSPSVLKGLKDSKCPLSILYLVFCWPLCCGFIFFLNVPSLMHGTKLFFHCVLQFFRGLVYSKYLSLFSFNIIRNFRECFRECSIMDYCFMFVYNIDNCKGMKCNQTNFVFTDSVVMNMKRADRGPSLIKPQVFSSKLKKYILRIIFFIVYFYFVYIAYYQNSLFVFLPRCRGGGESPAVQPSISVLLPI